nr:anaphase-promoting complex subunit 2 [Tanacetum cinerariifolium]
WTSESLAAAIGLPVDTLSEEVASVEDQLQKEMVYEKFITGMLQSIGGRGMALDIIHNRLVSLK